MARSKRKIPFIEKCFRRYLESEDSAEFIRSVASRYTECTLGRLATGNRRGTRRAAVMALGFFGSFRSNGILGEALRDRDRAVRLLAENGIRSLWNREAGELPGQKIEAIAWLNFSFQYEQASDVASELIEQLPTFAEVWNQRAISRYGLGQFEGAIADCDQAHDVASELIEQLPSFAEAWNQRAISGYGLGQFERAIADCHQALELNAYHFLAASGMGNCYLQRRQSGQALECFQRALKLNPGLDGVRAQVDQLQRTLG